MIKLYLILIVFLIFFLLKFNYKKYYEFYKMYSNKDKFLKGSNFISLNLFRKEEKLLVNNKYKILNDLNNLLESNKKWSVWDYDDNKRDTNNFSKLTDEEIINRLNLNKKNPKNLKSTWTIYGLILNGKVIVDNKNNFIDTINILKKIPNIINAGFSCLAPNTSTDVHNEIDKNIYRIHLPLIIPKGDCAIQVQNEIKKWYDCKSIMIFDDRKWHNAWNYTKSPRYVLIIDVPRKYT